MACKVERPKDHQFANRLPSYRHSDGTVKNVPDNAKHKALCETRSAPEKIQETESLPGKITNLFWKAEHFQHFYYVYNLTMDCESRVEKLLTNEDHTHLLSKDIVIKIAILGDFNDDNIKSISKRKGEHNSNGQKIWEAVPLICFQNDVLLKSAFQVLASKSRNILDKSDPFLGELPDKSIIIDGQNKKHIITAITVCLEEPLRRRLQKWGECLKLEGSGKPPSGIITEIESIRKLMVLDNTKDTSTTFVAPTGNSIIPVDVEDFLIRKTDVTAFGIWGNSSFKLFVQKGADVKSITDDLMKINQNFFDKYHLEIYHGRVIEKQNLKQGECVLRLSAENDGKLYIGTLGGFMTTTENERKIYALTCNHVFPNENQIAYAYECNELTEIGACIFTTREKGCDFAAVEVIDSFSDKCDLAFRRDDKKKINAKVYTKILENGNFVHKIGASTDVTNGIIVSSDFCIKVIGECNREHVFLVKGTAGKFSTEGDSGSLVFSRPNDVQQNHVNVLGMVYANNLTICEDDDEFTEEACDFDNDRTDKISFGSEGSQGKGAYKTRVNDENEPSSSKLNNKDRNSLSATRNEDIKDLSVCYRLCTALDLFKERQSDDFDVKFKDDLSSSSSSLQSLCTEDLN